VLAYFEIGMNDSPAMQVAHCIDNLPEDISREILRHIVVTLETFKQIA